MKYSTFSLEKSLLDNGYSYVGGIDEAGRGCLAGPVVAAVVVISNSEQYIPGVWDSKVMSGKRREGVYDKICEKVESYGIGTAEAGEVDELGISEAGSLAMHRAYGNLSVRPDIVLIDGERVRAPNLPSFKIKQGDRRHYVISAASVLAKVFRDRLVRKLAESYPGYGFEQHVGYGTKQHLDALRKLGVTEIHRRTFSPVKRLIGSEDDER